MVQYSPNFVESAGMSYNQPGWGDVFNVFVVF